MALSDKLLKIEAVVLCISRKWWRQVLTWTAVSAIAVNGLILPMWNREAANLSDLAILFTAVSPMFIAREVGKYFDKKLDKE